MQIFHSDSFTHATIKLRRFIPMLLAMVFLLYTTSAIAFPIRFDFTGNVTLVDADASSPSAFPATFNSTFDTSQTLSGFFTFDSATPDTNINVGNPYLATYVLTSISFTITDTTDTIIYTGGTGATNAIQIINAHGGGFGDLYRPYVIDPVAPAIEGISPDSFDIDLRDTGPKTALNDDSLPWTPPDLSSFTSTTWELRFQEPNTTPGPGESSNYNHIVSGEITSLTVPEPVPEPSTVFLLGTGLLGLAACYGYRRRKAAL